METYKEIEKLIRLFQNHFDNKLTEAQKIILDKWLSESEENRIFFSHLTQKSELVERLNIRKQISVDAEWEKLNLHIEKVSTRRFKLQNLLKYAAVFVVVLALSSLPFVLNHDENHVKQIASQYEKSSPSKVVLTWASGETLELGAEKMKEIVKGNAKIRDSQNELTYYADAKTSTMQNKKVRYNTITVPRGEQYKLKLQDGSKIHLNSESYLKFPDFFAADNRSLELGGEAYFEVAKDARRPFYVKMGEMKISVLGTKFNARSYYDENMKTVSLIEGSVQVEARKSKQIIQPGQQAFASPLKPLAVRDADMNAVTAWLRGEYIFENERLENIMKTLSRWYDCDVVYKRESVKKRIYTGSVKKYKHIQNFLHALQEIEGFAFTIKNDTLTIN